MCILICPHVAAGLSNSSLSRNCFAGSGNFQSLQTICSAELTNQSGSDNICPPGGLHRTDCPLFSMHANTEVAERNFSCLPFGRKAGSELELGRRRYFLHTQAHPLLGTFTLLKIPQTPGSTSLTSRPINWHKMVGPQSAYNLSQVLIQLVLSENIMLYICSS